MPASGPTTIQLCGRLLVEIEGRRVEDLLPARQGRLLFAYLALNIGRPVRRAETLDCLWPEQPPADAAGALNTVVSRLRRVLGPTVIAGRSELSLVLPPDAVIDVRFAAEALDAARSAAAGREWRQSWEQARAALVITERELLPGLAASWLDEHRRRFADLGLEALEAVAEAGLGLAAEAVWPGWDPSHGDAMAELAGRAADLGTPVPPAGGEYTAAEQAAAALVERAPFRESGYQLHMRILAARGNVAEALMVYERLRQLLREELGTVPSPVLVALHERLLRGEYLDTVVTAAPATPHPKDPGKPKDPGEPGDPGDPGGDFVGRERELAVIECGLDDVRAARRGLVLISGEPGIGKTRLAEELSRRAASAGCAVLWGRCFEGPGAPAFWPWMEIIRSFADRVPPEQLRRTLGPGGGDLAQILPELREVLPDLPRPAAVLDPDAARFRFHDSFCRFLQKVALAAPVVLVLDDLQWADAASLELVRFVVSRPSAAPVAIVATYRGGEVEPEHPLSGALAEFARQPLVRRVELGGLGASDTARLISGITGRQVGEALAAEVHRRTAGNPFFVAELAALLGGEETEDGGEGGEGGETETLPGDLVPVGVRDVIRSRLGRLPGDSATVLTVAAVIGEQFDVELLAIASKAGDERTLELVETAQAHRVLTESSEVPGRYRFSHALIRATLYSELSGMRRARLHAWVAEAIEALHGEQDTEHAVELAHHLYQGAPAGTGPRAVAAAVRAAEVSLARLAFEQAEQQLRRALGLLGRMPRGRERSTRELDVHMRLGGLLRLTKGYAAEEVGATCARTLELCRELGAERQMLASLWRFGVFHEVRGEYGRTEEIGTEVLELGERADDPTFRMVARVMLGAAAMHTGRLTDSREHLEEAIALADSPEGASMATVGHDLQVTPRCFLAQTLTLLGDTRRAQDMITQARRYSQRRPKLLDEALILFIDTMTTVVRHEDGAARTRAEELFDVCSTRGIPVYAAMATMMRGWVIGRHGEPDTGVRIVAEGLAAFRATGARMLLDFYQCLLAETLALAGRPREALAAIEDGLRHIEATGGFYAAELHRLRGVTLYNADPQRQAEATASLQTAVALAQEQKATTLMLRATTSLRAVVDPARPSPQRDPA